MKKNTLILLGFIALKFILSYFSIGPEYELHRDEFLHLDQANHLAWGYYSVPPFTSWISTLILWLGNTVFWVKFFPTLFGALTLVIVWKAIEELNGSLFALILGATCILFSSLLRLNILYQPNSFDILSWTVFYYFLLRYFKSENAKWLFSCAIVFALGFLNKYNFAFLIIGLIPAFLFSVQRKLFTQTKLYAAIVLGIILISPNLIWQYTNHFPVIKHLNELAETQLVNVNRFDFLKSQLLYFVGSIFVLIAALYALLFYNPFKKYQTFLWSLVFTLAVFTYLKAKGYYAIGLYPIYFSFGSVYLGELLKVGWKKYLQPVVILIPILLFIPIYPIVFPLKSPAYITSHHNIYKKLGMLKWEDGKEHSLPQDFADMLGWKELAQKVDSIYSKLPNKEKTLIICDNYGQAGAINYYTKLNLHAVSFNADYINWFDLTVPYENLMRVKEANNWKEELKEIAPHFQNAEIVDSITNLFAREYGTSIYVFTGAKIDLTERVKKRLEVYKKEK